MNRVLTSALMIVALAATGCSKSSGDTASASASPGMVYSGSTDTSTGGAAATAAPAAIPHIVGDAVHGKLIYTQNCSACHGASGAEGGVGPSLKGEKTRKNTVATITWIHNPAPPMPKLWPSPLNDKDVADVTAYVQSL